MENENTQKASCKARILFLFKLEDSLIKDYQGLRYDLDSPAYLNFIKALAELENEEAKTFKNLHYDFEGKGFIAHDFDLEEMQREVNKSRPKFEPPDLREFNRNS